MSLSETSVNQTKKELPCIKKYEFDLYMSYILKSGYSYDEYMDLEDLRNAKIYKLILSDGIVLHNKSRLDIINLLSNTNINKIILNFQLKNIAFFILIFQLLRKNSTIKEITLILSNIPYSNIHRNAWIAFFEDNSYRIIKVKAWNNHLSSKFNDLNKLIYSNSNLKEIDLLSDFSYFDDLKTHTNILKYILNSKKYLDEFTVQSDGFQKSQEFFDSIRYSNDKAEINTLILKNNTLENYLFIIDNAYLFNVETIKIDLNKSFSKQSFESILKLSLNTLNTIKRVIFTRNNNDCIAIILELLNCHNYIINRIPKIFVDEYKEIIIYKHNNTFKVYCLYEISLYPTLKIESFNNNFIDGIFDRKKFVEMLLILFNSPENIQNISIDNNEDTMKERLKIPQYNQDISKNIISAMKDEYETFRSKNNSKKKSIKKSSLRLCFKSKEVNVFFFTLLEIIYDMKIKIDQLELENCSIGELADFMDKHKKLESLNINYIKINNKEIDRENIDKLYLFSHLIGDKILIKKGENLRYILTDIYNYGFRDNSNLVYSLKSFSAPNRFIRLGSTDIGEFIKIFNNNKIFLENKDIYVFKNIKFLHYCFDVNGYDFLYESLSLFKKHQFIINRCIISYNRYYQKSYYSKKISFIIETILDIQYREKEVNYFTSTIEIDFKFSKFGKKNIRYLKKHMKDFLIYFYRIFRLKNNGK